MDWIRLVLSFLLTALLISLAVLSQKDKVVTNLLGFIMIVLVTIAFYFLLK